MEIEEIKALIRDVPDFPEPGIVFKDITPVLADPIAFSTITDLIVVHFGRGNVDKVVGIEARGFILASPVAYHFGAGFVPIRKKGKLPCETRRGGVRARVRHGHARAAPATHRARRARADRRRRPGHGRHRGGRRVAVEQIGGKVCGIACADRARLPARPRQAARLRALHTDPLLSAGDRARRPRPYTGRRRRGQPRRGQGRRHSRPARRGGRLPLPRRRRDERSALAGSTPLLKKVRSYNPKADLKELEAAFQVRPRSHEGQHRHLRRGLHRASAGGGAASWPTCAWTRTTLEAALLHDTVEDTAVTLERHRGGVRRRGRRASSTGSTKLDQLKFRRASTQQAENVRKMIVAMAGDIRVLLIKLADRLHNMRTLDALRRPSSGAIATETLEIYAPLANRLGVQEIKWELEDLVVQDPAPRARTTRSRSLVETRARRAHRLIEDVTDVLAHKLKELGIKARRRGPPEAPVLDLREDGDPRQGVQRDLRPRRHPRSRWSRCATATAALGAVHALWKPVPGPLQGLHRDAQVQHVPVAAHDGRRPRGPPARDPDPHARHAPHGAVRHRRALALQGGRKQAKDAADLAWLGQMMDWLKDMADPREFMEGLRIDLSGGRVFVFTPKGDVVNLPQGATPVDFAYAIHTDVGHRTIGAKVGGQARAARLRAADRRRRRDPRRPRPRARGRRQDWLQFVATPRARNKIRQWFARGRREDALEQGKDAAAAVDAQAEPAVQAARDRGGARRRSPPSCKYPDLDALYVARRGGPRVAAVGRGPALARLVERHRRRGRHRGPARAPRPDLGRSRRLDRASWSAACPTCGCGSAAAARRCRATRSSGSSRGGRACQRAPHRLPEREVARGASPSG